MKDGTIYAIKGKTRVLKAKGYEARMDTLGFATGEKEDILEFYRNNRYNEIELEVIKVTNVRGNSRIEDFLKNQKEKEARVA